MDARLRYTPGMKLPLVLAICALCLSAPVSAQQPARQFYLVLPTGKGAIAVPQGANWQPDAAFLYDHGTRAVLQFKGQQPGVTLSLIFFPNQSGQPTAESCREDVLQPLLKQFDSLLINKSLQRGQTTSIEGTQLATATYALNETAAPISAATEISLISRNSFSFYGDQRLCGELHISQVAEKIDKPTNFDDQLKELKVIPDYQSTAQDLARLGSILYESMKDYGAAAAYYESAVQLLPFPTTSPQRTVFRYLNDQLALSLGLSGNLKRSREVNQAAIAVDPDYPLYYYNLACVDAEERNVAEAQHHLQQAFARRANTIPGESLPDPTKDDSFQKLRKDKSFWLFLQTLPRN